MTRDRDDRLAEAKAKDIGDIAQQLEICGLLPWPPRHGMESVGPCPKCGGRDRFSINQRDGVFNCRRCEGRGDVISLVRFVRDCSMPAAIDWLIGPEAEISEIERKARRKASDENRRRNEDRADRERQREIKAAGALWREVAKNDHSALRGYLDARGITADLLPEIPAVLRYHPALPYMVRAERGFREVHRGPAMLAVVQQPSGRGIGCHRTWFDPASPQGKIALRDPETDADLPRKKMRGSKRGAAIRLHTPDHDWHQLVMGEGIETTLTAMCAGMWPEAAFWAGVDLAGR